MVMRQLVQTFEDNPAWYKNPEMVRQVLDRAIDLGANVKMEETKKPKAPTLKPMENKDGKWTYHEWKDGKWVDTGRGAKAPGELADKVWIVGIREVANPFSPFLLIVEGRACNNSHADHPHSPSSRDDLIAHPYLMIEPPECIAVNSVTPLGTTWIGVCNLLSQFILVKF